MLLFSLAGRVSVQKALETLMSTLLGVLISILWGKWVLFAY